MTTIAAASREVATHRRGSSTALRREWFTSAVVIASLGLFVWSLNAAGVATVIGAVSNVRLWFGAVLLLGGLRYLARAAAWRLCLERPSALPLSSAFAAVVAAGAIGSVTPLGAL